jgi:triosephosphate isomerase
MESERTRKYFLGANWKCNGNTAFVKDIITHLINTLNYDPNRLGISSAILYPFIYIDLMVLPGLLHISLVHAMVKEEVLVGAQNLSAY